MLYVRRRTEVNKYITRLRWNLKNLSRGLNPPKPGLNLAPAWILKHFKWNQPYLSRALNLNRRSNSLNSATGFTIRWYFSIIDTWTIDSAHLIHYKLTLYKCKKMLSFPMMHKWRTFYNRVGFWWQLENF